MEELLAVYYLSGFINGIYSCFQTRFGILSYVSIMLIATTLGFAPLIGKILKI